MEWVRGESLGQGTFGSVNLAIPKSQNFPLMAVKSTSVISSASLKNEKEVLSKLSNCANIIKCFGDSYSYEKGEELYNIFLEFASSGSLSDRIKNSCNRIPESKIKEYTRGILRGLQYVHENGFVHCDIKHQNILFCSENGREVVKIADFGLAKKARNGKESGIRGTPLYMSPESVTCGEYESPADIWALGCLVVEMVTGKPAWTCAYDVSALLFRIGVGEELPGIPEELSREGKDFLSKCFVKDPKKRWTAEMLLDHPFVLSSANDEIDQDTVTFKVEDEASISPRCPFDFPEWVSHPTEIDLWSGEELDSTYSNCDSTAAAERIQQLATNQRPDWSVSYSWVTVR